MLNMNRLLSVLLLVSVLSVTDALGQVEGRIKPPTKTTTKPNPPKPPKTPKLKDFTTEGFHFFVVGPSEVAITPDKKPSGHLVIPASVTYNGKEYQVVKIGYDIEKHTKSVSSYQFWTFEYNDNITSVTIPYGVKTIGKRAFNTCKNLTSVSIPNSVTSIEEEAFDYCENLSSVVIPNSVKTIGRGAFTLCFKLGMLTLPSTDIDIHIYAFFGAKFSKPTYTSKMFIGLPEDYQGSYTIPDGITTIATGAFSSCKKLASITIPSSVNTIGDNAFSMCYKLSSIELPYGIKRIGSSAFYFCNNLISIKIPGSVTYIGENAFKYSGLKSISIPDNVTQIAKNAFYDCPSLTQVSIPYALIEKMGEGVFGKCPNLQNVTVRYPDGREEKMPLREIWTKEI